jgi:hypothetical protein
VNTIYKGDKDNDDNNIKDKVSIMIIIECPDYATVHIGRYQCFQQNHFVYCDDKWLFTDVTHLCQAVYVRCIGCERGIEGKAVPLQPWTGPECSRMLRLPDLKTIGT